MLLRLDPEGAFGERRAHDLRPFAEAQRLQRLVDAARDIFVRVRIDHADARARHDFSTVAGLISTAARAYNTANDVAMERRMQPFDLVIRGGTVATATDSFKADVGIRGATIAAI